MNQKDVGLQKPRKNWFEKALLYTLYWAEIFTVAAQQMHKLNHVRRV